MALVLRWPPSLCISHYYKQYNNYPLSHQALSCSADTRVSRCWNDDGATGSCLTIVPLLFMLATDHRPPSLLIQVLTWKVSSLSSTDSAQPTELLQQIVCGTRLHWLWGHADSQVVWNEGQLTSDSRSTFCEAHQFRKKSPQLLRYYEGSLGYLAVHIALPFVLSTELTLQSSINQYLQRVTYTNQLEAASLSSLPNRWTKLYLYHQELILSSFVSIKWVITSPNLLLGKYIFPFLHAHIYHLPSSILC